MTGCWRSRRCVNRIGHEAFTQISNPFSRESWLTIVPCFTPRSITFCSPVQRNINGYSPGVPRTEAHGRLLNLGAETRNIEPAREMISPADVFHKDDLSVCETLRELLNSTKSAFCQTARSFCSKDYQFANLGFLWQQIRTLTSTTWQRKQAGSKQQVCAPRRPRWSVSWPEPPPAPSVVWPRGEGTLSKLAHDESCSQGKVMWSLGGAKSTNTRLPLFGLLVGLYWHHWTTNPHIVSHLSLSSRETSPQSSGYKSACTPCGWIGVRATPRPHVH